MHSRLLQTRLFKPLDNRGYIKRQRLLDRIELNWHKRFHLVLAGAGYGKSILISHWLDQTEENHGWISLDQDCNDLRLFVGYLGESMKSGLPFGSSELAKLAESFKVPELSEIEHILIQEMDRLKGSHVFVLDDYHLIENENVHRLMDAVIRNLPERHKLIVISRMQVPLNLLKAKAYDQVHEIRLTDLKFIPNEIQVLSNQVFSKSLKASVAQSIFEASEGWIVPIRLMLKGYYEGNTPEEFIKNNNLPTEELATFLLEEVLNFETPLVKESLMFASLFEEFDVSLLSEICADQYPEVKKDVALLENDINRFISQSMFLIPLDEKKRWYRFHHLTRVFLQRRVDAYFSKEKKMKAIEIGSRYFEETGDHSKAIKLNVEHGLFASAIKMIEGHRNTYMDDNRSDIIDYWLDLIPARIVEEHLPLILLRVYLSELSSDVASMSHYLRLAEPLLPDLKFDSESCKTLYAEYYSFSSALSLLERNPSDALHKLNQASQYISKDHAYIHGFHQCFSVVALVALGKEKEARKMLERELSELSPFEYKLRSQHHIASCFLAFLTAQINLLRFESTSASRIAKANSNPTVFVLANYYAAFSNYISNDLKAGYPYLEGFQKLKYDTRPGWILHSLYLKALYLNAECREAEVMQCFEEMDKFNESLSSYDFTNDIMVMKCELFILKGSYLEAWRISSQVDFNRKSVTHRYYCPRLTEAKLIVLAGDADLYPKARDLLNRIEKEATKAHNRMMDLQVMCLKAILLYNQGDLARALKVLGSVLNESKKSGIIRLYTDAGPLMWNLLKEMRDDIKSDAYVSEVIRSFDTKNAFEQARKEKIRRNELLRRFRSLSETEIRILGLISQGLRNKEISDLMHYSLGTVKTYVYNIYKKIEVNNRTKGTMLFNEFNSLTQSKPEIREK